jgi:single-strand DNA-binding protein
MINNVVLVGRLTKEIILRQTTNGINTCSFTIACDRKNSKNNEADFINCVAWRQSADFLNKYARKGNKVGVEGRITTRNYKNNNGQKVYVTEVTCEQVQVLESKNDNN